MGILGTQVNPFKKAMVQFIVNDRTGQNTVIQLDASLRETHSRRSPASKFPIENGISISDHMIIEPFSLELNGIITDSPIGTVQQILTSLGTSAISSLLPPIAPIAGAAAYAIISSLKNSPSPSVQAYAQLLQLQQNSQPFDVLTSLFRYPSMWIEEVSAPRDNETGNSLIFTVKLSQLILVSPQSVNIQVFSNPALSANQGDLGQQGTNLSPFYQAGFNSGYTISGAGNAVTNGSGVAGARP